MAKVQKGLETTCKPGVTLANYQESKIRWLHQLLGEWVGPDDEDVTPVDVRRSVRSSPG